MIEDTIPKLESFHASYAGISAGVDDLLNRIDGFSVSAISNEGLASKSQGLQVSTQQAETCFCAGVT